MKNLKFILLMVLSILIQSNLKADQFEKKTFETGNILPSEQTQNELEDLAIPTKIGTRQAPDEPGWAQKETPISGINTSIILLLIATSSGYIYAKTRKLKSVQK